LRANAPIREGCGEKAEASFTHSKRFAHYDIAVHIGRQDVKGYGTLRQRLECAKLASALARRSLIRPSQELKCSHPPTIFEFPLRRLRQNVVPRRRTKVNTPNILFFRPRLSWYKVLSVQRLALLRFDL
jgi:hypothetical protein